MLADIGMPEADGYALIHEVRKLDADAGTHLPAAAITAWRFDPFWGPGSGPVRFTCMRSDARRIWAAAPGILRGRPGPIVRPENGYTSRRAERAQLLFDSGFTIDGEIFRAAPTVRDSRATAASFARA
jgi:hypothetical protein